MSQDMEEVRNRSGTKTRDQQEKQGAPKREEGRGKRQDRNQLVASKLTIQIILITIIVASCHFLSVAV